MTDNTESMIAIYEITRAGNRGEPLMMDPTFSTRKAAWEYAKRTNGNRLQAGPSVRPRLVPASHVAQMLRHRA